MSWSSEKGLAGGFLCILPNLISEPDANPFHKLEHRKDDDPACSA